jgi:hypothetical protein
MISLFIRHEVYASDIAGARVSLNRALDAIQDSTDWLLAANP